MENAININQYNSGGGSNNISINPEDAFRPYEKALSVGEKKAFLDDASENLIRDGKLHLNENYINQVRLYLESRKLCLIKAPEGRGKTYLSRILAYDYYHNRGKNVYFLDLKYYNGITLDSIDNKLQEWHKNSQKDYLLVIENVHAYKDSGELWTLINSWINSDGNIWFLLNTRPTDVELEEFADRKEIVELCPNQEDVNDIINLFSKEVGREPFANAEERILFVEKIYPEKEKASGANLRLLRIYLETWQNNSRIQYVSGVSEKTVINGFRRLYLARKTKEEVNALWYISSLFQFDVPLYEDFVQNVGNLVEDGLLRFEENRYHLPHSVDASFLYKSICDYKKRDYTVQMKTFTTRFVESILSNDYPKEYERDFKLLFWGLYSGNSELKDVIYSLTNENLAKEIITKVYPAFIIDFFRPENHAEPNPNLLIDYYHKNKGWLIPVFKESTVATLYLAYRIFKKHLGFENIIESIFEDANDLADYLRASDNNKLFIDRTLLMSLIKLGEKHKTILIEYYKNNKDRLKPLFLGTHPSRFGHVCHAFKRLSISIVEDIFQVPNALADYLKTGDNYKTFINDQLIVQIANLGEDYKAILVEHYEKNKAKLKPLFLGINPSRFGPVCRAFKRLSISIIEDIFETPNALADYLRAGDNNKVFINNKLIVHIADLGEDYIAILVEHYEKNKAKLKQSFLGTNPAQLYYVCHAFKRLSISIVEDIFEDPNELTSYLRTSDNYKAFINDQLIVQIANLGEDYKAILVEHYEKNKAKLKPLFLGTNPAQFYNVCRAFKQLSISIVEDIFEAPNDLTNYLSASDNYKIFIQYGLLMPIAKLGEDYKSILVEYYEKNKAKLKPLFLEINPTRIFFAFLTYRNYLNINILEGIFESPDVLETYLKNHDVEAYQDYYALAVIKELGDEYKRVLGKYNAFDNFFYSTKSTKYCLPINQRYIHELWSKRRTFDISYIQNKGFYLDGVSWAYLQRFVSIIKENMTEENRQQSVNIVSAIIKIVLAKDNAFLYVSANDLAYFYYNIASVDEAIFQKLAGNYSVRTDIERRLNASSYNVGDLYLFDLFFSQSWCKAKLEPRILNADVDQEKIMKVWYDKTVEKLRKRGKEITSGSLLDFIHYNL